MKKVLFILMFCTLNNLIAVNLYDTNKVVIEEFGSGMLINNDSLLSSIGQIKISPKTNDNLLLSQLLQKMTKCDFLYINCAGFDNLDSFLTSCPQKCNINGLEIWEAKDTVIPRSLFKFTNLRYLSILYWKNLRKISPKISEFKKLVTLTLAAEKPNKIPKKIFTELKITDLELELPSLKSIPKELNRMNSLESLRITGGNSIFLPKGLNNLKHLKSVVLYDVVNLDFNSLIFRLSLITSLKNLSICNCNLKKIPNVIIKLKNLSSLIIQNNKLTALNNEMLSLNKLEWLDISYNPLESFNINLCKLNNLKTLILDGTKVRSLDGIRDCNNNLHLYLRGLDIPKTEIDNFKKQNPNCQLIIN